MEQLERHPQLRERVQAIVDLTQSSIDQIRDADELEALLQEQLRLLGKTSIQCWASRAEQQVAQEFKQQNKGTRYGKKKT